MVRVRNLSGRVVRSWQKERKSGFYPERCFPGRCTPRPVIPEAEQMGVLVGGHLSELAHRSIPRAPRPLPAPAYITLGP